MNKEKEHHIWCNFFSSSREGCKLCEGLYNRYPMDGLSPEGLLKKHFPDVYDMNFRKTEVKK